MNKVYTAQEVADKLRSDVINTIPMWRNQMVLALGIEHSRRALNAQSAVTDMTNEMFRRNAETLKQGAIDAALASEKALVDVETLKKVNADIITSINEVVKIHEEGTKKRSEAQAELAKIEAGVDAGWAEGVMGRSFKCMQNLKWNLIQTKLIFNSHQICREY